MASGEKEEERLEHRRPEEERLEHRGPEEERLEHRRPEEERLEHRRPVQGAVVTSGAEKWESTGRGPESCVEMSGVPEMFIQREMVGLGGES